ncbi:MAG: metallophosphoesterase [Pseudomonadota bacterium]
MLTRREFFKFFAYTALAGMSLGGYAIAIEPSRLSVARYRVRPRNWPEGLSLRIAALADLHACEPWMNVQRIRRIVAQTNSLKPDVIVLLGDYSTGHRYTSAQIHSRDWSKALSGLNAPLGVHAILGNHDWWDDLTAQKTGMGPTYGQRALERHGINVLHNQARRLDQQGTGFWVAGLGDQLALTPNRQVGRRRWQGLDDLPGTLAQVTDDAPVLLLAHEPDIFPQVPDRVALTLCGHTHGGQVRIMGYSPVVPSRYGNRYTYGHVIEQGRHMIVSGGLGCSIVPVRFGMPPEITLVEIGTGRLRDRSSPVMESLAG